MKADKWTTKLSQQLSKLIWMNELRVFRTDYLPFYCFDLIFVVVVFFFTLCPHSFNRFFFFFSESCQSNMCTVCVFQWFTSYIICPSILLSSSSSYSISIRCFGIFFCTVVTFFRLLFLLQTITIWWIQFKRIPNLIRWHNEASTLVQTMMMPRHHWWNFFYGDAFYVPIYMTHSPILFATKS